MRTVIAVVAALSAGASGASGQWVHARDVAQAVEEWRESWHVPGVAVAIIRGDEVLLLEGFGVRRLGDTARVDANTLFELGSATKTFTATLAAMAVDEGLVAWDSAVEDLLPGFRLRDPVLQREITLLDALTHRSGIGRNDVLWLSGGSTNDVMRALRHIEAAAGLRETFTYSNVMYMVAGAALETLYGDAWDALIRKRIFVPLGMTRSRTSPQDHVPNVASPHVQLGDTVLPAPTPRTHAGPAGALMSTASDLVQWMRFQLRQGGAVAEQRLPRVPLPLAGFGPQYDRSTYLAYGTGWFVSDYAGRRKVDHIGGHGGMVTLVTLLPDDSIGVAVLANHGDNLLPVAVTNYVLDLLLGLEPQHWNDRLQEFWDGVREARSALALATGGERVEGTRPSLPLTDYAGPYVSPVYGETVIELQSRGLVLRHGTTLVADLEHWHYDTFRITWRDPFLRAILGTGFASFDLDAAGRPARVTWSGLQGERIQSERVRAMTSTRRN